MSHRHWTRSVVSRQRRGSRFAEKKSHDGAVVLSFDVVLLLQSQPKHQSRTAKGNHAPVESIAHWHQDSVEGPFHELSNWGDEILGVHGVNFRGKNKQCPQKQ